VQHGPLLKIVLLLVGMGQAFRKFTCTLVVHLNDAGDAVGGSIRAVLGLEDAGPHEVAHRL
jgi:hypothetical protein